MFVDRILTEAASQGAGAVVLETSAPALFEGPAGASAIGAPIGNDELFEAVTALLDESQVVELAIGNVVATTVLAGEVTWSVVIEPRVDGLWVRCTRDEGQSSSAEHSDEAILAETPATEPGELSDAPDTVGGSQGTGSVPQDEGLHLELETNVVSEQPSSHDGDEETRLEVSHPDESGSDERGVERVRYGEGGLGESGLHEPVLDEGGLDEGRFAPTDSGDAYAQFGSDEVAMSAAVLRGKTERNLLAVTMHHDTDAPPPGRDSFEDDDTTFSVHARAEADAAWNDGANAQSGDHEATPSDHDAATPALEAPPLEPPPDSTDPLPAQTEGLPSPVVSDETPPVVRAPDPEPNLPMRWRNVTDRVFEGPWLTSSAAESPAPLIDTLSFGSLCYVLGGGSAAILGTARGLVYVDGDDPARAAGDTVGRSRGTWIVISVDDPSLWLGWVLRRLEEGHRVLVDTRARTPEGAHRSMLGLTAGPRAEAWLGAHYVGAVVDHVGIWSLQRRLFEE